MDYMTLLLALGALRPTLDDIRVDPYESLSCLP